MSESGAELPPIESERTRMGVTAILFSYAGTYVVLGVGALSGSIFMRLPPESLIAGLIHLGMIVWPCVLFAKLNHRYFTLTERWSVVFGFTLIDMVRGAVLLSPAFVDSWAMPRLSFLLLAAVKDVVVFIVVIGLTWVLVAKRYFNQSAGTQEVKA